VNVRTTMMLEDENPKTKVRKPTETRATADALVYDESKRLATYTATGKTPARLTSAHGDMRGQRIDLFLKASGNELERAELDENVSVVLEKLYATGKHLVYTAATDKHVLTGDPVISVQKDEQGSCKETRGTTLTYERSIDRLTNVGIADIAGFQTKPLPACPVELRH
jgi:lipopolysaccharide export system protein LptA